MWFLGLIALFAGFVLRGAAPRQPAGRAAAFAAPLIVLGVVLLVASPIVATAVQVPAGHRGVVTRFGSVQGRVLVEGLNFVIPFAERALLVDVRVQPHNFKAIEAAGLEYQTVRPTGTMKFHLDPP